MGLLLITMETGPWPCSTVHASLVTMVTSSSGRGCQTRGENFLEWNTFRLTTSLKNGDIVGCGWVRADEGNRGTIYFTLNGDRVPNEFHDTPPEMFPFVHIQKKVNDDTAYVHVLAWCTHTTWLLGRPPGHLLVQ